MAPNTPKVSILLPSLNARKFLEERVESLLNQTFVDWEVIVLDSHSTDGSWEFLKTVAETDSRFRPHQLPREGLYSALNRGLHLATGEFLYIAPCDDTMAPEFFAQMIETFGRCPDAGIAACDCLFINQSGQELQPKDMFDQLSKRRVNNLLRSGNVRGSVPWLRQRNTNYRPVPHDCLLHFTGRSVYFSLTQLLIRTASAKAAGFFDTNVGSVADFCWLVRLTSLTGSVHLPKKLAAWRFHGDQLSLRSDNTRLATMSKMCESILPEIRRRYPSLLTQNDCELLLLPYRILLATSVIQRVGYWLKGVVRLSPIFIRQPLATLHILHEVGVGRDFFLAAIFQQKQLAPRDLDTTG
ncbi:MAG: glycosyltransferase [Verrucomicrobia bacterium]|nr:glycosyltransferase [Verrucomicrobiota bacterium]